MSRIRVLIADDHALFREGLTQILEMAGDFEIVGNAENGQVAIDLARRLKPDVVLMDINMPVVNGIEATGLITRACPETRVIMLTIYRQDRYLFDAIKAGARGYLLKDVDGQQFIAAVHAVARGEALIDPGIAAQVLTEFRRLSQPAGDNAEAEQLNHGEMEVLQLVARGADNRTIAEQLNIAEQTVANRLRDIFQKLHVNNRTQAALVALRRGWAPLDEP